MNPYVAVHEGVNCNQCQVLPIRGVRYKCGDCDDYDICAVCFPFTNHNAAHTFLLVKHPRIFQHGPLLSSGNQVPKEQRYSFSSTDKPVNYPFGGSCQENEKKTGSTFYFNSNNNNNQVNRNSPQTFQFSAPKIEPTKVASFSFGQQPSVF